MPYRRKEFTYGLGGGFNTTAHRTKVGDEQCTAGSNWAFNVAKKRDTASIIFRPGFTFEGATSDLGIGGVGTGTDTLTAQGVYRQQDGTEYIVSVVGDATDGVCKAWDGTTVTTVSAAHADFRGTIGDSENYQNKLYMVMNGAANKLIEVTSSTAYTGHALVDVDSNAFNGSMIKEHEDHMYIAGDTTRPHRLFISVTGDPTDYATAATGAGYVDFPSTITGMGNAESYLIVHTASHGCYKLLFSLAGTPSRYHIPQSKGTVAHRSIAEVDNQQIYLANDGVYTIGYRENYPDEIGVVPVSYEIQTQIDNINDKSECAGIYYKDQYFLSYRDDADATNTYNDHVIVYDFRIGAWTAPWHTAEGEISSKGMVGFDYFNEFSDNLYVCQDQLFDDGSNLITKAFLAGFTTYTDTGYVGGAISESGAIEWSYKTKEQHFGDYESGKHIDTTTIRYRRINGGNPVLTTRADNSDVEFITRDLDNITPSSAGTFYGQYLASRVLGLGVLGGIAVNSAYSTDEMDIRTGTRVNGHAFKTEFYMNTTGKAIELLGYSIGVRLADMKRRSKNRIY